MCGITGHLNNIFSEGMAQSVRAMTDTLVHRGPDDSGVWADEGAGIALGHRRLSILDLSATGHQPMTSGSGRYVMVFNGEIYNHLELRARLLSGGHGYQWRGHSDTESLVACLDAWGLEKTLRAANGMFALAVWDKERDALLLARDRIGEKPLYYGWQGNTFLFGSELKALKAHPDFTADIDRDSLTLFLRHNYIPSPYSIYKGIRKLPAGTWLEVSRRAPAQAPRPYWQLSRVIEQGSLEPFAGSDHDALDQLETTLLGAVRRQMISDVPLGALLSGGIDSSTICALLQANSKNPIKTFTIGFSEAHYNEADHARAVARHLRTDHTELLLGADDALSLVPDLAGTWDEPFADSSQLPTLLVMKLARKGVSVALSGDGADELFGGYNRYTYGPGLMRRMGWMPTVLRQATGALLTGIPTTIINRAFGSLTANHGVSLPGEKAHKLGQKLKNSDFGSIDELYLSLLTEWPDSADVVINGDIPRYLLNNNDIRLHLDDPASRMMALDTLGYLPDDILVKVDRAAMAVSLETRAPFLDKELVEFSWSLPMHMKQRNGQGKWLLRQLLDRYVPYELVDRPKMGFAVPLDDWLRGPLRTWAGDLLAEDRLTQEGFLNPGPICDVWRKHCSGKHNYGQRLWSVLMFQSWLEANT